VDTLTVSLLTYEPRFDVGSEEWYVDVHIDIAAATDPFVRLGMVRYQEHAPAPLQVSQPVVEWTQLLPQRDVRVEVTDNAGSLGIEVTVVGLAAEKVADELLTSAESRERYNRPVMTFLLMFESKDRDGRRTQQLIETVSTDEALPGDLAGTTTTPNGAIASVGSLQGQTRWWARFSPIDPVQRAQLGAGQFFVTTEEVEYRHPASYPGREPLTLAQSATDTTYVASGPRFFARIDLAGVDTKGTVQREIAEAT
jgi:hypothetical protein